MNKESIKQFLRFGLVGVLNTLVSQLIYMLFVFLGAHYIIASIFAFIISVLVAYLFQNVFVFKENTELEKRKWWIVLLKTYIAYSFTGLLLSNLLLVFWIDILKIENLTFFITNIINKIGISISNRDVAIYIAPLLNIVVNLPINFLINKFWAYRQKEKIINENNENS